MKMTMSDIDLKIQQLEEEVDVGRKRLTADRMDISFGELINLYRENELVIRPEYQRSYRWNDNQKTALIESLLLSIPIPPIFVAENEDGVWELIDGLQRVSTFLSFFGVLKEDLTGLEAIINRENDIVDEDGEANERLENLNKWELKAGSIIDSLEGFTIDTLPQSFKINLKRSVCRVEILRGQSRDEMKYELFKRLNSGGSKLTPQEIRNAIYRGIDAQLNDLLLELSNNNLFTKMVSLSNRKKQELYDQELILKFIAFVNNVDNINLNTEHYLNRFMENTVNDKDYDYESMKKLFIDTLTLIDNSVDNPKEIFWGRQRRVVASYFDSITVSIAQNLDKYKKNPELIQERINVLKQDEDFRIFAGTASNSRSRVKSRLKRANEIFSS